VRRMSRRGAGGWLGSSDSEPPAAVRAPLAFIKHHIQIALALRWGLALLVPRNPLMTTTVKGRQIE